MNRDLVILLSLTLLFNVVGCEGKKTKVDKVVLRYVSFEVMPSQVATHRAIVDKFNESQKDIFVKLEIAHRGTEEILTQIAGGNAPDVFLWSVEYVYSLVKRGALLELTPFLKSSDININDYFTELFDLVTLHLDERLYAFPMGWGVEALAYNKDLFDKAGIAYPDENWTWNDFVNAAQKLTVRENGRVVQYGTIMPSDHVVLLSFGAKRFNDNLTRCTLDSQEAKDAFQFLVDLSDKYKVIPNLSSMSWREQYRTAIDMFMNKRVAMYMAASFQFEALSKLTNIRWDIAPIPRFDGRKRRSAPGLNTLVIYSKTKYPEQAWKFIKFACGKEGLQLLGKNTIPAHKGVAYENFCTPPPEHIRVIIDQYEESSPHPEGYTDWGREFLENVYFTELEKMLLGLQSVDETVKNMVKEGEKFLRPQ
ncbi:MAG: sugar ABC transporter substrate-binding protein [Planctomycetes bacterium]|nr:sugar ABC transporter substrate-binding protein [Planctomycetota bacterium]